jgi:predicted RNA binding protein YcfA (HicA-like mRNA interferase family)
VPRLSCTYARFVAIIEAHGFVLHRHDGTSHRLYRAVVRGTVHMVTVAGHRDADDVPTGTLQSMIRQSGLPKSLFRR